MKINTNDINKMVYEGVKKIILEHVDVLELAREQSPQDLQSFFIAFTEAFGEKGRQAITSGLGYRGMQQVYDQATPEERLAFEEKLKGIDFELDPDVQASLMETIKRVVREKLSK